MRALAIIILLVISNLTIAQTTAIPDANFEQELINLGLDVTLDGAVLTANIDTIAKLVVNGKNISDLTGIEDFTALTHLNCFANNLTSLNVTQNTLLEYLDCANNPINTLNVTQNIYLTKLRCFFNQLSSLNVTQNTVLDSLECQNNLLNTIDITQNSALTYLDCDGNLFSGLDITQNTNLSKLRCNNNQLTSLDLSQSTSLKELSCSNNSLIVLDFSQNTNIIRVFCNNNQLSNINIVGTNSLTTLYCYNNQLTNLDVSQNSALALLRCDNNQLTSLNVNGDSAITEVICSYNQLTTLNLSQNPLLEYFFCLYNQLSCLNIKSGGNTNILSFIAVNNPNLTCVEVDNVYYSNNPTIGTFWTIDSQTSYSNWCNNSCSVGIDEQNITNLSLYPNPTTGNISIDLGEVKSNIKATLSNSLGQIILSKEYGSTDIINIDVEAPRGIYFIQLESGGEVVTRKIIKE